MNNFNLNKNIHSALAESEDSYNEDDYNLESYNFSLPEELIAQEPCYARDHSRLLVLERNKAELHEALFSDLAEFLPAKSLLVTNNVKVAPLRLVGVKDSGGRLEFLLLTPIPLITNSEQFEGEYSAEVEGLMRGIKNIKLGTSFNFGEHLSITILEKMDFGRCKVILKWRAPLALRLIEQGRLPLPPYIKREPEGFDAKRYQTFFAQDKKLGAAAAPTAGLHFTPVLRQSLLDSGYNWTELSLYVGYGTFSPVRTLDIREHTMHSEYLELNQDNANLINEAKSNKQSIVAVGTTSARAMEGTFAELGKIAPYCGGTDIFVYPGRSINVVDHLITNFHLPKSSLLMLVSAFTGRKKLLAAYEKAIEKRFRFFSYGDAMLIL